MPLYGYITSCSYCSKQINLHCILYQLRYLVGAKIYKHTLYLNEKTDKLEELIVALCILFVVKCFSYSNLLVNLDSLNATLPYHMRSKKSDDDVVFPRILSN